MVPYFAVLVALSNPSLGGDSAYCVPRWAQTIEAAKARGLKKFRVPGCSYNDELEVVPCSPEAMRKSVERQLHESGLYPPWKPLRADVYGVARNVRSEAGSGSPSEKVAMAEAALNRASYAGWPLSRVIMKNGTRYGRQRGTNPPVSTRQDPYWDDLVVAELVLTGQTRNFARGATHYWSPNAIDSMHRQGRHRDDRWSLYDRWSGDWGMAWVGPLPGVNHNKQFLMVGKAKRRDAAAWAVADAAGKHALARTGVPREATLPICGEGPLLARGSGAGVVVGLAIFAGLGYLAWKEWTS
jgi:hypothetical protein